jgi:site-specific recombinase XerD
MARWQKMHADKGITERAIAYIVVARAAECGVADVSPHDLRRSLTSDLLDEGVDLATVQRVARHASPATTVRYDRRSERTKRDAARRARVLFVEPAK